MKTDAELREENAKWFMAQNKAPLDPSDRIAKMRFSGSALRWSGLSTFVKDTAFRLGIYARVESEKSWFREHIRAEIHGTVSQLLKFEAVFKRAVADYNSEP